MCMYMCGCSSPCAYLTVCMCADLSSCVYVIGIRQDRCCELQCLCCCDRVLHIHPCWCCLGWSMVICTSCIPQVAFIVRCVWQNSGVCLVQVWGWRRLWQAPVCVLLQRPSLHQASHTGLCTCSLMQHLSLHSSLWACRTS